MGSQKTKTKGKEATETRGWFMERHEIGTADPDPTGHDARLPLCPFGSPAVLVSTHLTRGAVWPGDGGILPFPSCFLPGVFGSLCNPLAETIGLSVCAAQTDLSYLRKS